MVNWNDVDNQITDPAFFAGPQFHELFTLLREEDPVHLTRGTFGRPYWSVTNYADNLRLLQEPELFSSRGGSHLPPDGRDLTEEERYRMGFDSTLVSLDPPLHGERRRPLNKHFSVPAVSRMQHRVEEIVDDIIAAIAPAGQADVVEDICALVPVNVFLSMMGVPKQDWTMLRKLTLMALHHQEPEFLAEGADPTQVMVDSTAAVYDYMAAHTMRRREDPQDDFASLIATMEIGGKLLSERDASWYSWIIVVGGLETTRNAGALGIMELMARPEQAALLGDDAVAKSAVEEILRWVTPSKNKFRIANADTVLGGKQIRAGDWLAGWIVSANRDEKVFDRPQEFDVLRTPNKHLGFGDGEHMCLGRNVARLELKVLVQKIFAAFPDLTAAGEAEWVASDNTTGLKRFPVRFRPRLLTSS